jgi:hypothetical protein
MRQNTENLVATRHRWQIKSANEECPSCSRDVILNVPPVPVPDINVNSNVGGGFRALPLQVC